MKTLTIGAAIASLSTPFGVAYAADGATSFRVLRPFRGVPDGLHSHARLIGDPSVALYGTADEGGEASAICGNVGCGVVFRMTPRPDGTWTRTILYRFKGGADGVQPATGLFLLDGELFGSTVYGGNSGFGTVFRLRPPVSGVTWNKTILHHFAGGTDGRAPNSELALDRASGTLYGLTELGGDTNCNAVGCGTVFRLAPAAGGNWNYKVIHRFGGGAGGAFPYGGLVPLGGSLIGTTPNGGGSANCPNGCGTVYRLDPPQSGDVWTEAVLHAFEGGIDGKFPTAKPLLLAGSLYGTTRQGGDITKCSGNGCGTVFQLSPPSGASSWTKTVLHAFQGGTDGDEPTSSLIADASGALYGVTQIGGRTETACGVSGCGTIFKVAPPTAPGGAWTKTTPRRFRSATDGRWPYSSLLHDRKANALFGVTAYGANSADGGSVFRLQLP